VPGAPLSGDAPFRLLVEQVQDYAIFMLDPGGHIATWNNGAQRLKGYTADEIIGRHFSTFYRPEDVWKCAEELATALQVGRVEDEGWRLRKDGTTFWANVVITCLRDTEGRVVGFTKVTRDLTERMRTENALRQSEERLRLMVESVKDYAIFMLDRRGCVATWNVGAERIKGYSAQEIVGQHFSRFYPQEDVLAGKCEMELEVATRDGRFEDEGWRIRKDGSRFWANVVITALRDATGETVGFAKVTRDLTERRAAEIERLRLGERARSRLHALAGLADALTGARTVQEVALATVERGTAFVEADVCTLYLRGEDDTLRLLAEHGTSPALLDRFREISPGSGNPFHAVGVGESDGVWVESEAKLAAIYPTAAQLKVEGPRAESFACLPLVAEGRTLGMMSVGFFQPREFSPDDREFISTFARQCAQALARARGLAAEQRSAALAERLSASLATTVHSIGDGVIATDAEGRITILNSVAQILTGWSEDEARGRHLDEVFHIINEQTREAAVSPVQKVLETGGIVGLANHTLLIARDGTEIAIDDSAAPIRAGSGPIDGVVLVFRDVTERKRDESRRVFLAEATSVLAQSLDYETTVARVAELAVPLLADWCAVDLVVDTGPLPQRLAVAHVDPAKAARARELAERYPPQADAPAGVMAVLRSGNPELYPSIPDERTMASSVQGEHWRQARELGVRSAMIVPLTVRGRVLGALTFAFAESGRTYTQADLQFVEGLARRCANAIENSRLYASEQRARHEADVANRAKDEFLAVVSHELRTPLNAITGWSKMLLRPGFDERRRQTAVETIERNADAMTQLIEDLLDMSRVISGKLRLEVQRVDPASVAEAAVESVRPVALTKGVALVTAFDDQAPIIVADPTRLQQIVWNLVNNAVKFTPKGGRVTVSSRHVGSSLEIAVTDTGKGISATFLPQIFEAFRQEPGSGRSRGGLGLGLAITKQLVELHGGTVAASSEGEGRGATFTVLLPILTDQPAQSSQPRVPPQRRETDRQGQLQGLRVLVVDDDDDAREMLASILEDSGCQVTRALDVASALRCMAAEVPDVLLSDVAMPGEDGYDLIRQVRLLPREAGGDVPAAAITAYARSEDRRRLLNSGFSIHLPKPIDPAEVIAVVTTLTRFIHRRDALPSGRP
jgi:PAS domain S-box-containing protein